MPSYRSATARRGTSVTTRSIAIAVSMAAVGTLAGCGGSDTSDDGYTIGVVNGQGIAQFPFYQRQVDGTEAAIEALGEDVELIVSDGRGDPATEAAAIDQMILRDVDAILYTPGSVDGGRTLAAKALAADIPVIAVDQSAGDDTTAYVGYDNVKLGEAMAQCVVDSLGGEGRVAGQPGILGTVATEDRRTGWNNVFSRYPDITYGPEIANNYDPGQAFSITQDVLTSNSDIDAIMTMDDTSALGVVRAVQDSGADVFIQGLALNNDAMQSLRDGGLSCDVYMSPYDMGYQALEIALAAVNGDDFDARPELPYPTVTAENVDEIAEQPGAGW